MLKTTLWYAPEGFHFEIIDPEVISKWDLSVSDERIEKRYSLREGCIGVGVISEFSEIPITVAFDRDGLESDDESKWDMIIEVPFKVTGKYISFSNVASEFGRLELGSGNYRMKIHYGGQNTRQLDGSSSDFYLIQIWPSNDKTEKIIKPLATT